MATDDPGGFGFDVVLRRRRLKAGLTQEELASRAAIGVRTVRDLERGRASRPQRTTVELLAAALGLTAGERDAFLTAARRQLPEETRPPAGLPQLPPPIELIGRDGDVTGLSALLTGPTGPRGVTLAGIAGVGKTCLALAVAHRVADAYPGGVAGVVAIEGVSAGELAGAVAAAFGVARPADLAERFAGRPALLFVDAVDRAPEGVARGLSQLLAEVPSLRFLATGRHPTGLGAERVWTVSPLVTPPPRTGAPQTGGSLAELNTYPSIGLFLKRLSRVRDAELAPEEIAPLATLVRRLGGLPMAIELAAARGRVLTVPEILDRYGDRVLDLSHPHGGPEAVVTVRDAVGASYRLLSPGQQHALRRLATFRYRWSLALAEQMIEDTQSDGADVVHLLDRLLELGLVGVRGSRTNRFQLLDVVRDYATERAAAEGELAVARHRHARIMAQLVDEVAPELSGSRVAAAVMRLDDVGGDLSAALGFAADADPQTALRIASGLPRWWRFRGRDVSGRRWLRRLLDDPRNEEAEPRVRAWAGIGLAQLALEHGAGAEEIGSATTALELFERIGSLEGQATAHTLLAALWMTRNGYREARRHGESALALARRSGRVRDMAVAENNLIWHEIREADLATARRRLAAVDRLAGECGEDRLRAVALVNLAEVARLDGHPDEAERLGRQAMPALEQLGDPTHRRRLTGTIGLALAELGRLAEAREILAELRGGDGTAPDGPSSAVEAAIALREGEQKLAAECFRRAADAYAGTHDPRDVAEALVGLIASTPDAEERAATVRRLEEHCRAAGITLLPRERKLL